MSEDDKKRINEIVVDEWIWVIFIILSILNITGDEFEKKFCRYHTDNDKNLSKKIFKFTVFISFLIYLYLFYKNYNKYKILKENNKDFNLASIRCFSSAFVVIGAFLSLYAQVNDNTPVNPSIE